MAAEVNPIHEELKKLQAKNTDFAADRRLAAQGQARRQTIHGLFGRRDDGSPESQHHVKHERFESACLQILELPVAERESLLSILFPKMAAHVSRAIGLLGAQPLHRYGLVARGYRLGPIAEKYVTPTGRNQLFAHSMAFMMRSLLPYRSEEVLWIAPRLAELRAVDRYSMHAYWPVLVAAIDVPGKEGDEVFRILEASVRGTHETSAPSYQAYAALLACNRPEAWEVVESMLRAAQREEGLRQTILEVVDLSHPTAFRRMLRLVVDEDMVRFSSVARAINVWLGLLWDSAATRPLRESAETVLRFLEDRTTIATGLKSTNAQEVYFALWSLAFDDVGAAIDASVEILQHPDPDHRFAALRLLLEAGINEASQRCVPLVDDPDLRVASYAATANHRPVSNEDIAKRLRANFARWPRSQDLGTILFPWIKISIERSTIADRLVPMEETDLAGALPFLREATPSNRASFVAQLSKRKTKPERYREFLLELADDASAGLPKVVYLSLGELKQELTDTEWIAIEEHLQRKTVDLRSETLTLLMRQADAQVLRSASRLSASSSVSGRTASLEVLRRLVEAKRSVNQARAIAANYATRYPTPTEEELLQLAAISGSTGSMESAGWSIDNGFGLFDPAQLTKPVRPEVKRFDFVTPAAIRCLRALETLIHEHRETPVTEPGQSEPVLLGERSWFPQPDPSKPLEKEVERFTLRDVWETWYTERSGVLRDADGLELARALHALDGVKNTSSQTPVTLPVTTLFSSVTRKVQGLLGKDVPRTRESMLDEIYGEARSLRFKYPGIIDGVLTWLNLISGSARQERFAANAAIQIIARVELPLLADPEPQRPKEWYYGSEHPRRHIPGFACIKTFTQNSRSFAGIPVEFRGALWRAFHWLDVLPLPNSKESRAFPPVAVTAHAWIDGFATDADLIDQFFRDFAERNVSWWGGYANKLAGELTGRKLPAALTAVEQRIRLS